MASRRPRSGSSQGWPGRFGRVDGAPSQHAVNGSRRTLRDRRMCDIDSGHELRTPAERTEGPLAWTVAETVDSGQAAPGFAPPYGQKIVQVKGLEVTRES